MKSKKKELPEYIFHKPIYPPELLGNFSMS